MGWRGRGRLHSEHGKPSGFKLRGDLVLQGMFGNVWTLLASHSWERRTLLASSRWRPAMINALGGWAKNDLAQRSVGLRLRSPYSDPPFSS